jgi:hypothetical protein
MLDGLEERLKGRVLRGRTLARAGRVQQMELAPGTALAGVQDAEIQRPTVRVRTFDEHEWAKVLSALNARLSLLAKLFEGEVADDLLAALDAVGVPLVPRADEIDGDCDCGDWAVPCAHGAALHHVLGEALDGEPFLLFTLRGRPREQLLAELRRAWGDAGTPSGAERRQAEEPDGDGDPFTSANPSPAIAFRFHGVAGPPGMLELGPLAGDDDLHRALAPLYDAGAAAAVAIALAEGEPDGLRRRRGRSAIPQTLAPERRVDEPEIPEDLTERIVDLLADAEDGATADDLAKQLGISSDRARAELDELSALGLVSRSGRGAEKRWWLG